MITFFNMQNNNKAVKEGQKLILNSIAVNQKLFVPMIAKVLDIKEAMSYEDLGDEKLATIMAQPEQLELDKNPQYYAYHTDKNKH